MLNPFRVDNAIKFLLTGPDGSVANAQARERCKEYLLEAAAAFQDFAALKPDSDVAKYLITEARRFEIVARMKI